MTPIHEAMIVAGGAGTRLRPLTRTSPKPLLPFCGEPFLLGVIRRLAAVGVRHVLLVVGADTAPFASLTDPGRRLGVEVATIPEPEPLDTAGGVRSALDRVSGPFYVLNGDILTDVDLTAVAATHRAAAADATLVLTRVEDTSSYGVCVRDGDRIVGFVEKPPAGSLPGQDAVNAGTYLLEPDAMARFPAGRLSFERDVFPGLVDAGAHVAGMVFDGAWADLGTPDRFRAGQRLVLDGGVAWPSLDRVPAGRDGHRLAPGVTVHPDAVVTHPVLVGPGTTIAAHARVGPHAVVGADVRIEAGATVTDTSVFDRTTIGAGARLDGALVGHDARIGEQATLAPDTVVGDGAAVPAGARLAAGTRLPDA